MLRRVGFLVGAGLVGWIASGVLPAEAVTPRTWKVGGVDGWTEAERESVGVTSDGRLGRSLAATRVEDLDAFVVWDLLRDGPDLLVATGDQGTVYRVKPSGAVTEEARVIQPEVTALGRDSRGRLLFGTAPDAILYRAGADGPTSVADLPELYIWDLLIRDEVTYVATGHTGRIYAVDGKGTPTVFANLTTVHVTGLALSGEDLIATTDSPGRLVRVGRDGSTEILYDAEEPELRAPVVTEEGILFLANPADGAGTLMRWSPSGAVDLLWSAPEGYLYRLLPGENGSLWVTAGVETGPGAVYRIDPGPPVSWMLALETEEAQVLTGAFDGPGARWIGTGGTGRVYRILPETASVGMVSSPVEDAGGIARWGALSVEPAPVDGGLRIDSRSGNTRVPDETWSDWERVSLAGNRGTVASPPARCLQWRIELGASSGEIASVRVIYLPANRGPRITAAAVSGLGEPLKQSFDRGQPSSLFQELPGGLRVEFQPQGARSNGEEAGDAQAAWARRYRAVTWSAEDPDGDDLRFDLFLRGVDETAWKPLIRDEDDSPWIWDSATVPDGWYVMRIGASDRADNPPGEDQAAYLPTDPFLVDNTPPVVLDLRVRDGALEGTAEDATSPIKRLEFAIDGREWSQVFPADGIPDMPREAFRMVLDAGETLDPGPHVAVVRVFDLAGNPGTGRVSFETR